MSPDVCLIPSAEIQRLRDHDRRVFLDDFVPWWEDHSIDREDPPRC